MHALSIACQRRDGRLYGGLPLHHASTPPGPADACQLGRRASRRLGARRAAERAQRATRAARSPHAGNEAGVSHGLSCSCTPYGLCGHPTPCALEPHQMQPDPNPCTCVLLGEYGHPGPYDGESHQIQASPWLSCLWWREGLKGQPGPKSWEPQYTHSLIAQPSFPPECICHTLAVHEQVGGAGGCTPAIVPSNLWRTDYM
jgi:hypothetical protein